MAITDVHQQQVKSILKHSKSKKRKHEESSRLSHPEAEPPSPTKKTKHTSPASEKVKATASLVGNDTADLSPFFTRTISLYLPVSPIMLGNVIVGLCAEHLSPLLLTYHSLLKGIVLSYSNPRIRSSSHDITSQDSEEEDQYAVTVAEYGACYVWLTADFLVLSPLAGTHVEGWVNVQTETHLGLVCWNLFNATIPHKRLPPDWKWQRGPSDASEEKRIENAARNAHVLDNEKGKASNGEIHLDGEKESGHWVDEQGEVIEGNVTFRVVMMDAERDVGQSGGFLNITGTMLDAAGETDLCAKEQQDQEKLLALNKSTPKRKVRFAMSGAMKDRTSPEGDINNAKSRTATPFKRKHHFDYS